MLALKYAAFAVIATIFNLASQYLARSVAKPFINSDQALLFIGLVIGTGTGLLVKYYLDKNHIFYYESSGVVEDAKKFSMYSLVGLITTSIFWGFEILFDVLFEGQYALYIGGALGLFIGYVLKYQIDKRFVFASSK